MRVNMRIVRRFPFAIVLVALWILMELAGASLTLGSIWTWFLVFLAAGCLFVEFYKSGDITLQSFKIDLAWMLAAIVIVAVRVTYDWSNGVLNIAQFIVIAVALADGWVSTTNAFRSSQRNIQAGVNTSPVESEL